MDISDGELWATANRRDIRRFHKEPEGALAVKLAGLEEAQFFVGNVEQRFGVSEEQYVGYLACAYEVDYPVSASLRQGCIGNFASTVCDLLRLPARDVVIVFTPVSQPDA